MNLTIVGCGKIGLPLAVQAARRRIKVTGVDINPDVVSMINRGKSPILEPNIKNLLKELVRKGFLKATVNLKEGVGNADAIIIIVPVLLGQDHLPVLDAIKKVSVEIGKYMKPGVIISFETTLPVGTTRNVLNPLLEKHGLKAERDFYLVYSPERVKSLTVMKRLNVTPKVIGGFGPISLKKGIALYKSMLNSKLISVGSLENAEMVKLAGMIYRDINIALVNELARYCDNIGIDLKEIIPVANTDGEAHLLEPGIGVGGHCTPVYPYFLINDAQQRGVIQSLAEVARKVNDGQTDYVLNRLEAYLGSLKGLKVLSLGLGFRPGVKEDANSPAYLIKEGLIKRKAKNFLCDPLYSKKEIEQKGFLYSELYNNDSIDAVILITAHTSFLSLNWKKLREKGVKVFIDGRSCFKIEVVEKSGIKYIGVGTGWNR